MEDGFGDADGTAEPTDSRRQLRMRLFEHEAARGWSCATFPSREQMEEMLKMGMEEGLRQAVGQMDGLLETRLDAGFGVQRLRHLPELARATSWTSARSYRNIARARGDSGPGGAKALRH